MEIISEGWKFALTQGVLGVMVAVFAWVAWTYKKEVSSCYSSALEREKAMGEIIASHAVAQNASNAETAQRTRAIEAQAQQAQAQALTVAELTRNINDLVQRSDRLQNEVVELRRIMAEGRRA